VIGDHFSGVFKREPSSLALPLLWPTVQQRGDLNQIDIGSDKLGARRALLLVDERS